jgi:acyl-CoA synthetase (AMP-forming)/AMP-acid ligase II
MKMTANANLFAALRAAFPADLDAVAVETDDGLLYSWRDLDRASAMIANLLVALELEEGARIAVQVEKSVEALMLYLATLRAGYVFLPLNTAYQSAEIEYFIGNAEPAVVVCSPAPMLDWVGPIAWPPARAMSSRWTTTAPARCSTWPCSAATGTPSAARSRRPRRHPLHQRHHRPQQGRDADAPQPAVERRGAEGLLGLATEGPRAGATC